MVFVAKHQGSLYSGASFVREALPELFAASERRLGRSMGDFFAHWGPQECLSLLVAYRSALSEVDDLRNHQQQTPVEIARSVRSKLERTPDYRIVAPLMEAWGMAQLRREFFGRGGRNLYLSDYEFSRSNHWRGPDGMVVAPWRGQLVIRRILEAKSGSTVLMAHQLEGWVSRLESDGLRIGERSFTQLLVESDGEPQPLSVDRIDRISPIVRLVVGSGIAPTLEKRYGRVMRVDVSHFFDIARDFFLKILVSPEPQAWLRIVKNYKGWMLSAQERALGEIVTRDPRALASNEVTPPVPH